MTPNLDPLPDSHPLASQMRSPELPQVTLDNLAGGALREMFDAELERVLENVLDPNTTLGKRTLKLTLVVEPTESRAEAGVTVKVESKLAPAKGAGALIYIGKRHGRAIATQYDPKQMQMAWDRESQPRVLPRPSSPNENPPAGS